MIYKDITAYCGEAIEKKDHGHHALQLFFCPDVPITMNVVGNEFTSYGALLAPDIPHTCRHNQTEIVFINIEPESILGQTLKNKFLKNENFYIFPEIFSRSNGQRLIKSDQQTDLKKQLWSIFNIPPLPNLVDERITQVVNFIKSNLYQKLDTAQLAEVVYLSESRLLHLFKQEIGIPIRKYILWLRIRWAMDSISNGANLTEAAHEAGFSDSAHLTRTFNRTFGLAPSDFVHNSSFVQAEEF